MRWRTFDLLAVAGFFLAYSITIRLALHLDFRGSVLTGAANTVPVVVFGAIARRVILRKLVGKPGAIQLAAHLMLCAAFVSLSYGLLIVLLGFVNGQGPTGFLVQPFSTSGLAWQSLENVTTYALIAMASYLQGQPGAPGARGPGIGEEINDAAPVPQTGEPEASPRGDQTDAFVIDPLTAPPGEDAALRVDAALSRFFVRIGDELRPIDIDAVVSIGGADDYAEVRTLAGKHLVRMTLAEFARSLDPEKYVRIHRSWIVNVHRVTRAEPAGGGRLLLHMESGQTISTSRTGAKLLRDRVI